MPIPKKFHKDERSLQFPFFLSILFSFFHVYSFFSFTVFKFQIFAKQIKLMFYWSLSNVNGVNILLFFLYVSKCEYLTAAIKGYGIFYLLPLLSNKNIRRNTIRFNLCCYNNSFFKKKSWIRYWKTLFKSKLTSAKWLFCFMFPILKSTISF